MIGPHFRPLRTIKGTNSDFGLSDELCWSAGAYVPLREDDKYLIESLSQNRDIGIQTNKVWPPEMTKYEEQAGQGIAAGEVTMVFA